MARVDEIARARADLDHHRTMARHFGEFADGRLLLIEAVREDRDAGDMDADAAAVKIAAADREHAAYLDQAAEHRRRAGELEQRLTELSATAAA